MQPHTRFCAQCGAGLSAGAAFCPSCGTAAGAPTPPAGGNRAWIAAALVTVLSLLAIAWVLARPAAPAAAPAAAAAQAFGGPAPDISTMSAREGFDRLFNRVMSAAEQGDEATANRFAAHALDAYSQLDSVDIDARYHAAALHAQLGQYPEALALADSMTAQVPDHLLAWVVRGTVAELRGDTAGLAEVRRRFLAAWNADPKRDRPEYLDHQKALDDFRASAGTK